MDEAHFWTLADELVARSEIVIDRPRGSRHPAWPERVYPLPYGHLSGTNAGDGAGIDLWRDNLPESRVTGAIVTIDLLKGDAEIKLLVGCTEIEAAEALAMHNHRAQAGLLLRRDFPRVDALDNE